MTPSPWWDRTRHADRQGFLRARHRILQDVRGWFDWRGFVEVEPAMIVPSPGAETHIDAIEAGGGYLHTSPEFAMKRLLAAGERKIFSLGKCWRAGESGPLHAPEFTMLEWYRADAGYEEIMADCVELLGVACATIGADKLRWKERECDPFAEPEKLTVAEAFAQHNLGPPASSPAGTPAVQDAFSRAIVQIEPHLGSPTPTVLYEYPIPEAALAEAAPHDPTVALRFELYACGVELANGFQELTDPVEQRRRLIAAMDEKQKRYGKGWPIDEDFLAALEHMPRSSGVAMGFDRLVMLATGARHINDVLDARHVIRAATASDYPAIRAVIRHAFDRADEANLVEQLRDDGDVLFELVEASDIALQGHIIYSRLPIARDGETIAAAALAPVSVLPAFQRSGLGKALIRAGNARCAGLGLDAIIVLGHPDYYPQFGFSARTAESLNAPFSGPAFMALELRPDALKAGGRVCYAKAFGV